jgi:hypothetical protein
MHQNECLDAFGSVLSVKIRWRCGGVWRLSVAQHGHSQQHSKSRQYIIYMRISSPIYAPINSCALSDIVQALTFLVHAYPRDCLRSLGTIDVLASDPTKSPADPT